MAFDLFNIENEVDFEVIALRSILPEYKLAYQINSLLEIQLVRWEKDLDLLVKKKEVDFATYQHIDDSSQNELYLLKNSTLKSVEEKKMTLFDESFRKEKFFLINELNGFDYILKNYGYSSNELIDEIKKISNIQVIKKIDVSTLKSIHHLIF